MVQLLQRRRSGMRGPHAGQVAARAASTLPRQRKRVLPSGITPLPWVTRMRPHRLVLPERLHTRAGGHVVRVLSAAHPPAGATDAPELALPTLGDVQRDDVITNSHRGHAWQPRRTATHDEGAAGDPAIIGPSTNVHLRPRSPQCLRPRGPGCTGTDLSRAVTTFSALAPQGHWRALGQPYLPDPSRPACTHRCGTRPWRRCARALLRREAATPPHPQQLGAGMRGLVAHRGRGACKDARTEIGLGFPSHRRFASDDLRIRARGHITNPALCIACWPTLPVVSLDMMKMPGKQEMKESVWHCVRWVQGGAVSVRGTLVNAVRLMAVVAAVAIA